MDPMMSQQPMQSFPATKKSRPWLVVVIIVALIVVAAVLYVWRNQIPFVQQYVGEVSGSDEVAAIEQDLQATNHNDLDSELSDIDKELAQ